jgi:hypothetical protein
LNQTIEWKDFSGKAFISDLGTEHEITGPDGEKKILGQFAVWSPVAQSERYQVVEVSGDLAGLKAKYRISEDRVLKIRRK